jgi:hypothetical protein
MTCEDVRTHIENDARTAAAEFWSDSRVAAHIASCADCSQFAEERQNLAKSLQLVRESVSPVSMSLDAAVLANHRRFMAERQTASKAQIYRTRFPLFLRWGAVAALLMITGAIAWHSTRKPIKTIAAPPPVQPSSTTVAALPATRTAQPQIWPAHRLISPAHKHSAPTNAHPAARTVASMPDYFRSLMYCDELSCDGAMDMIRVQLPSSVLARPTSAFRPANGLVNADVLIGPDGIARGIRIDE